VNDANVEQAFQNLLGLKYLNNKYRLCFFVDALDEFQETHHQTYRDLVGQLKSWIKTSAGALKMCVSSREDNVFQNKISSKQRIRLQDLTQDDMLRYTRDRLHIISQAIEYEHLVQKVVERSDGVFL
jgi:hypothetical protein